MQTLIFTSHLISSYLLYTHDCQRLRIRVRARVRVRIRVRVRARVRFRVRVRVIIMDGAQDVEQIEDQGWGRR